MLPGVVPLLRFLGVFDEIDRSMVRKHGAWFKIKADIPPGVIEWKDISDSPYAWNVDRAKFDSILLAHAERSGAIEICIKNAIIGTEACTYAQTEG
jgi:flavin-dependent dehydrogenase